MTKDFHVMKETLKQHPHLLQAQPLTFSQLAAVDLIYDANKRLMHAISEEGHESSVSITEPQCQLPVSPTAASHASTPPSMSLVLATHQPSSTLTHHPHPQTASVFMDLCSQPESPGEIESPMSNVSQAVSLLLVHTNQTVLDDSRALELRLASGLGDLLKSHLESGYVLQYPSASGVCT